MVREEWHGGSVPLIAVSCELSLMVCHKREQASFEEAAVHMGDHHKDTQTRVAVR